MIRWVPNAVTLAGALLGFLALVLWPTWLAPLFLVLSLAADGLDGTVARLLDAVSDLGADLDHAVDCGLAHALWWRVFPPEAACIASLVLVLCQAWCRGSNVRFTGRWLTSGLVLVAWVVA